MTRRKEPHLEEAYERLKLKLKEARTATGLSQAEVAGRLGRPQSFISKLETRDRRVDFIELLLLAAIYDKPIRFFADADEGGFLVAMGELDRSSITTADIAALETARA